MKLLLCLISAQHVPNLLSVHAVRPDKLILLVSKKMEEPASWLIEALAFGGLDYGTRCDLVQVKETNSIDHTKNVLQAIYEKYPGAQWIVNLTGGTKPMSMGAYEFFNNKGTKMLYIPEAEQSQALDLSGGSPLNMDHNISIVEFLAGYGFDLLNPKALVKAEERVDKWFDLAVMIAADHEDAFLKRFLGDIYRLSDERNGREKGMDLEEADQVFLMNKKLRSRVSDLFGLKIYEGVFIGSLNKHAVRFFTGGWLEVFIWGLLRRFEGNDIWDLHMGINFGKKGHPSNEVENEWDVAFMRDQSLCIVECKTGEQGQDPTGNDTLYKLEAIKNQLKAIRVRSYLATTASNVLNKEGQIKKRITNRARIYNCKIIPEWTIRELADLYISKDPRLTQQIAEVFEIS